MSDAIKLFLMVAVVVCVVAALFSSLFDVMRYVNSMVAAGLMIQFFSFWLFAYSTTVDNKDKKDAYANVSAFSFVISIICFIFS